MTPDYTDLELRVVDLLLMPQVWKKEPEYDPFIEPWGDQ